MPAEMAQRSSRSFDGRHRNNCRCYSCGFSQEHYRRTDRDRTEHHARGKHHLAEAGRELDESGDLSRSHFSLEDARDNDPNRR